MRVALAGRHEYFSAMAADVHARPGMFFLMARKCITRLALFGAVEAAVLKWGAFVHFFHPFLPRRAFAKLANSAPRATLSPEAQ